MAIPGSILMMAKKAYAWGAASVIKNLWLEKKGKLF
jgi:hypothetical protein